MYRLKELRLEAKLTQLQLSKKLNISQSVICDYENEKVQPTAIVLIAYCKYFGCSADYLLGLSDY